MNDFEIVGKMIVDESAGASGLQKLTGAASIFKTVVKEGLNPSLEGMIGLLSTPQLLAVVAVIMAIVAAVKLATFAWDSFTQVLGQASEVEQVDMRLQSIIANTQKLGGVTFEAADEMAKGLERLTGVDDEVIKSSSAVLLTFEGISKQTFPRAQQAAMDLAAAMGKDLGSASLALGKALEQPANAAAMLRRQGIILDESIANTIKRMDEQGRTAAAQALLLQEVEKRVGGVAAAMGGTFQGELNKINNLFNDLGEDIGAIFLPTATAATSAFRIITEEIMKGLEPGLKALQGAFKELGAAVSTPEMKAAFKSLGKELGKDIAELVELFVKGGIPAIKQYAKAWKEHGPEIVDTVTQLADAMLKFADAIGAAMEFADNLGKKLEPWIDLGKNIIKGIIGGITDNPDMLSNALQKIVDIALKDIKKQLGIASASKVAKEQVGRWLPAGIAEGITENMGLVKTAMGGARSAVTGNTPGSPAPALAAGGPTYHLYNPTFIFQEQDTMDTVMARMNVSRAGA